MQLFKSGNPTLTQKIFEKSHNAEAEINGTMTVRGAINKFGLAVLRCRSCGERSEAEAKEQSHSS